MIPNNLIQELINHDEPVGLIWEKLLDIWTAENDIKKHYEKELLLVDFEKFIHSVYDEFYTQILPKECQNNKFKFDEDSCWIFMDGMSIREGTLIFKKLKEEGYNVNMEYGFSSLPSSTERFRTKIGFKELRKKEFAEISQFTFLGGR